jgi:hypothetical protein
VARLLCWKRRPNGILILKVYVCETFWLAFSHGANESDVSFRILTLTVFRESGSVCGRALASGIVVWANEIVYEAAKATSRGSSRGGLPAS